MRIELSQTWGKAAFVVLCLLLGGASARGAGVVGNCLLQILAIIVIAVAVWKSRGPVIPPTARSLLLIVSLFCLYVLLSLVPLPPAVWQALPGREAVTHG